MTHIKLNMGLVAKITPEQYHRLSIPLHLSPFDATYMYVHVHIMYTLLYLVLFIHSLCPVFNLQSIHVLLASIDTSLQSELDALGALSPL